MPESLSVQERLAAIIQRGQSYPTPQHVADAILREFVVLPRGEATDTERLDWLEAGNDVLVVGERMTVRESIDAAMKHPVRLGVQMITAARSHVPQDGEAAK